MLQGLPGLGSNPFVNICSTVEVTQRSAECRVTRAAAHSNEHRLLVACHISQECSVESVCGGLTSANLGEDSAEKGMKGPADEDGTSHGHDGKPNGSHKGIGHFHNFLIAEVSPCRAAQPVRLQP